jgi:hypothetical protein
MWYFFLSKRRAEETLCPISNILNIKEKIVQRKLGDVNLTQYTTQNVANKDKTIKINYIVVMEPTLKGEEKPKQTQTYQTLSSEPAYGCETK